MLKSESAASDVLRRTNVFFKSSDHEGKACNAQHPDQLFFGHVEQLQKYLFVFDLKIYRL